MKLGGHEVTPHGIAAGGRRADSRVTAAMWIPAILAAGLLGAIALFQAALALGAPWGRAAWGGGHPGVLPMRLRIASAVAGLAIYPAIIVVVLASASVVNGVPGSGSVAMWVLTVLFLLGGILNLVSRSRAERAWGLVGLVIAGCCAAIAMGA